MSISFGSVSIGLSCIGTKDVFSRPYFVCQKNSGLTVFFFFSNSPNSIAALKFLHTPFASLHPLTSVSGFFSSFYNMEDHEYNEFRVISLE